MVRRFVLLLVLVIGGNSLEQEREHEKARKCSTSS